MAKQDGKSQNGSNNSHSDKVAQQSNFGTIKNLLINGFEVEAAGSDKAKGTISSLTRLEEEISLNHENPVGIEQ